MYAKLRSSVRVNGALSDTFNVTVGVHQGSLLFIIVMETLSREFRTACPWELLYADDLVIISDSIKDLVARLNRWNVNLEKHSLKVNASKTKVLISNPDAEKPVTGRAKFKWRVCNRGVGANSIMCNGCGYWIHQRCLDTKGALKQDINFKCRKCLSAAAAPAANIAAPVPVPMKITSGNDVFDVVPTFCYLGDTIG